MSKLSFLKNINRNTALIGIAIIGIIITGVLIFADSSSSFSLPSIFGQSNDQVAKNTIDYINNSGLSNTPASLVSVSEESGLVKMKIKVGTNEFDTYVSKDGKLLFPQAPINMGESKASGSQNQNANTQTAEEIIASIKKTDKPALEAFIVSRCPFGLQMQRMIADAIKNVPSLSQYIKVRYMGSASGNTITSMHGDAEAQENLRQICIRDEQASKYWNYVSCQMKASGTETSCEKSTGVDSAKLNACISDTGRGVAYAKEDFALSDKYGVTGSPTLILDGKEVAEFTSDNKPVFGSSRSSDELKTIVCTASNTEPSFCSTELNTAQAATSFSETYASSGSADSTANCE